MLPRRAADLFVRENAIWDLTRLDSWQAVPTVSDLPLNNPEPSIQETTLRALGEIGAPRVLPLRHPSALFGYGRRYPWGTDDINILERIGDSAIVVVAALVRGSPAVLDEAEVSSAMTIPNFNGPVYQTLLRLLGNPHAIVRRGAAFTLGRIGHERWCA